MLKLSKILLPPDYFCECGKESLKLLFPSKYYLQEMTNQKTAFLSHDLVSTNERPVSRVCMRWGCGLVANIYCYIDSPCCYWLLHLYCFSTLCLTTISPAIQQLNYSRTGLTETQNISCSFALWKILSESSNVLRSVSVMTHYPYWGYLRLYAFLSKMTSTGIVPGVLRHLLAK